MNIDLPTFTILEAVKNKIKHFNIKRPCLECGSTERYLPNLNPHSCLCVGCYPEPWKAISCKKLKTAEKNLNKKKEKMRRDNWSIPVVFGGFNTV